MRLKALLQKFLPGTPLHLSGITLYLQEKNTVWKDIHSEVNLQQAFEWLCQQSQESHHNNDVWDFRRDWGEKKAALAQQLRRGEWCFKTVRVVEIRNDDGKTERREVRCAEDRCVIRAITQILQPILQACLSKQCSHLKGNGGLKQAVADTHAYIAQHPNHQVIKSDVKGYYASINHDVLAEQLRYCLPHEPVLHRYLWCFLRRSTEWGGNYSDVSQGYPWGLPCRPCLVQFTSVHWTT